LCFRDYQNIFSWVYCYGDEVKGYDVFDTLHTESINRHEIVRACSVRGRDKNTYRIWLENVKGEGYLRDIVVGRRIILK
jgi:hypothetical protein